MTTTIKPGCYVRVDATGMAGRVSNKYRFEGKTTFGVAWGGEYKASELTRITPAEFHATPLDKKIGKPKE